MKTNKTVIICLFICVAIALTFCLCCLFGNDNLIKSNNKPEENFFKVDYINEQYYYDIYDINGNVIYTGSNYKEPEIILHKDNSVSLIIQVGTGPSTRIGLFFDIENSFCSKEIMYVLDYSNGWVVYGDGESNIIIESVFNDSYYEIIHYSQLENPASDIPDLIMDANLSIEEKIVIVTYVSADHKLVTQRFAID